jgi:hypothetical protein
MVQRLDGCPGGSGYDIPYNWSGTAGATVIRISSLSEIIVVTTVARVRGVVVVAVMAGSTVVGNGRVRPEQLVDSCRESGMSPVPSPDR